MRSDVTRRHLLAQLRQGRTQLGVNHIRNSKALLTAATFAALLPIAAQGQTEDEVAAAAVAVTALNHELGGVGVLIARPEHHLALRVGAALGITPKHPDSLIVCPVREDPWTCRIPSGQPVIGVYSAKPRGAGTEVHMWVTQPSGSDTHPTVGLWYVATVERRRREWVVTRLEMAGQS